MQESEAQQFVTGLFESWYPWLVRYARGIAGSVELAEDAAQEGFCSLYSALVKGQTIENPKAYTFCVVRRQVAKKFNLTKHETELICKSLVQPEADDGFFVEDEVQRYFAVLTSREEEVVLLRLQAMKYREIAQALGISRSSVNTLLARAVRKLRKAMDAGAELREETPTRDSYVRQTLQ